MFIPSTAYVCWLNKKGWAWIETIINLTYLILDISMILLFISQFLCSFLQLFMTVG